MNTSFIRTPLLSFSALMLISLLLLYTSACQQKEASKNSNEPLKILATTGMIADLAQNIGGDKIEVTALMGPGVDPHLYKATHGDLQRLRSADLVLYNGLKLEGKMGEVLEKLALQKPVFAIANALPDSLLLDDPRYPGNADPHVWFNLSLWAKCIPPVVQALTELAPQYQPLFEANAKLYADSLAEKHQWIQQQMATIPEQQRVLITAHDAFQYFGQAYGIEVLGLQGISTLSEFGLRDRVDMVDLILKRSIKAIFVESSVSEKNVQSIVESCQQQGHNLSIGGTLYSDAMGAPNTPEGTFLGMIHANVTTLVDALK